MTPRLAHLLRLYETVERMRSAELRLAALAVLEASQARQGERAYAEASRHAGWAALERGNRVDWLLADTAGTVSARRAEQWRALEAERQERHQQAELSYRASRMETGQIEVLIEGARASERVQAGRREQGISDDRFGARLHWIRSMKDR